MFLLLCDWSTGEIMGCADFQKPEYNNVDLEQSCSDWLGWQNSTCRHCHNDTSGATTRPTLHLYSSYYVTMHQYTMGK